MSARKFEGAGRQPVLEHAVLEGERVLLRPLSVDDVDDAFALVHQRREVLDWLLWEGPASREELVPWYASWAVRSEAGDNYHFAIVERASDRFCGSIGLRFAEHPFECDLGYWVGSSYWGRGRCTEALRLAAWLAFEHLESRLLYAYVFERNHASVRVLAKNDFREEPARRRSFAKGDGERPCRCFELDRARWEELEASRPPCRADVRVR